MKSDKLTKMFTIFVGISGCFSVLFAAWLAHAGQGLPGPTYNRLENALQIQFLHTLALLAVIVWHQVRPSVWLLLSGFCFFTGIVCFSGSLYVKTFFDFALIGQLAPAGGILLAFGWLLTIFVGNNLLPNKSLKKK